MNGEGDEAVRAAEARRLEAERRKLELEAQEIERRLTAPWWQGGKLPQYLLAIVVTAALLFAWTRVYLEPILSRETEINKLVEQRNAARNELLEAQAEQLRAERRRIAQERDRLETEAARLKAGNAALEREKEILLVRVEGATMAAERAYRGGSKFFSILNSGDPINRLKTAYGWEMWSDNYFGKLGYYLLIRHPDLRAGKTIVVGRKFEIDDIKREDPEGWRRYIDKVAAEAGPVLALDYSYFGLLADPEAPVGGMLYRAGGEDAPVHAPLGEWRDRLAAILSDG